MEHAKSTVFRLFRSFAKDLPVIKKNQEKKIERPKLAPRLGAGLDSSFHPKSFLLKKIFHGLG